MIRQFTCGWLCAASVCLSCLSGLSRAAAPDKAAVRKAYGIEKRELWTTGKVIGTPEPPNPYKTEEFFTKLRQFSDPAKKTFDQPLELATVPGQNRLCVVERLGKIYTFRNDPAVERAELMLDVGKTCYGLAFHPKFAENGLVYVTNVLDPMNPSDKGTRISRFKAKGNPPVCDAASEKIIIEWPSGGHNGGCLQFGPDGYLYIVTGDGSGIADELQTGQDVSDLLGAMLRIDVDQAGEGRAYGIPKDNPFAQTAGARPEIWAYGLRQAWKFNFDLLLNDLWAGEVGQDLWEMVYRIERGGNYGWSVKEGTHPFRPDRKLGPTEIIPPVAEHSHTDFRSITGGHVYRGQRLPELDGAYIYGDYDTGKVWSLRYGKADVSSKPAADANLRHVSANVSDNQELVDTQFRIIDFGQDESGEVYLLDFIGGRLHRLVKAPLAVKTADFPRKLSQTGLFASTKDHTPAAGLIPYSVNAPLWSDNAEKDRFIAVPGNSQIEYNTVEYPQPAPGAPPGWRFPDGTVIVKTFSLDLEPGNAKSRRRLETRLLHLELLAGTEEVGDQVWRGYTYVWNDDQTDAELLEAKGADRTFTIADKSAPGGKREQSWHFPSRTECTLCHTMPGKYVLGLNTLQMNKDHNYGGVIANQLATLEHLGLFKKPLPDKPESLPKLADYRDEAQPLEARARAYLHSNCAHCHMKWGGGNAEFQLLVTLDLKDTGTVLTKPGQGPFGIADAKIIAPGDPGRSLVHHRMTRLGLGRMPHIASSVVDAEAVKLIGDWITSLKEP